jgi:hypothetical protein
MYFVLFREREAAKDAEDRRREAEEIEELKSQIFANPALKDPHTEFQRQLRERERQFLPPAKLRAQEQEAAAAAVRQQQLRQQQQQLHEREQREREQRERTASPGRGAAPSMSPDDRGASPADSYNGGGGEEDSRDGTSSPDMVPLPPPVAVPAQPALLSQPVTVTGTTCAGLK